MVSASNAQLEIEMMHSSPVLITWKMKTEELGVHIHRSQRPSINKAMSDKLFKVIVLPLLCHILEISIFTRMLV